MSESPASRKIIYDIGANNGDDVGYYLKKADGVVAVEANPVLCDQIRTRFSQAIAEKRLVVENCVLTAGKLSPEVFFYINKENHALSQFPVPKYRPERFEKVALPSKSVKDLIELHGKPYYIKIDIERYDHVIVRALLTARILPDFISVEAHHISVFSLLATMGGYSQFKIVEGKSVAELYRDWPIETLDGMDVHSFQHHSAGPFGDDVQGDWMNAEQVFRRLLKEDTGWKDIHARRSDLQDSSVEPAAMWRIRHWIYLCRWFCSCRGALCKFLARTASRARRVATPNRSR